MTLALAIIFGIFGLLVEQRGVAQVYAMASVGLLGYQLGRMVERRSERPTTWPGVRAVERRAA